MARAAGHGVVEDHGVDHRPFRRGAEQTTLDVGALNAHFPGQALQQGIEDGQHGVIVRRLGRRKGELCHVSLEIVGQVVAYTLPLLIETGVAPHILVFKGEFPLFAVLGVAADGAHLVPVLSDDHQGVVGGGLHLQALSIHLENQLADQVPLRVSDVVIISFIVALWTVQGGVQRIALRTKAEARLQRPLPEKLFDDLMAGHTFPALPCDELLGKVGLAAVGTLIAVIALLPGGIPIFAGHTTDVPAGVHLSVSNHLGTGGIFGDGHLQVPSQLEGLVPAHCGEVRY